MLSIIIPTLNEAPRIGELARHVRAVAPSAEILVVDGGSDDGTVEQAEAAQLTVLRAAGRGRARQMNEGAAATTGEHLLFLHADTTLPAGVESIVARTLADPGVALGAFSVRLDRRTPSLRLIELGIGLRCRFGRMPYGDQALFLRRSTFETLGGYRELDFFEDPELVRRARKLGRIEVVPAEVVTSARLWIERGVLRVTARNWWLTAQFIAGRDPARFTRRR